MKFRSYILLLWILRIHFLIHVSHQLLINFCINWILKNVSPADWVSAELVAGATLGISILSLVNYFDYFKSFFRKFMILLQLIHGFTGIQGTRPNTVTGWWPKLISIEIFMLILLSCKLLIDLTVKKCYVIMSKNKLLV